MNWRVLRIPTNRNTIYTRYHYRFRVFTLIGFVLCALQCGFVGGSNGGNLFADDSGVIVDDIRVDLSIEEESEIGTVIGRIPVKPGFTYRFSETSREFLLNATSGWITTAVVLDREKLRNDRFNLVVLSSQPTYPVEVKISVVDVNDNRPTFPEPSIQVSFAESASPGTRVILDAADDKDAGNNSVAGYRIVSGNDDAKFRLIVVTNPSGETPYLNLETVGELDREVQSTYRLNISASDGGSPPLTGFLTVDVEVLDVNDNPPIFDHSDYVVSLNESVPPGTSVLTLHATDTDADNNARITYYLGNTETQFAVDPETGVVLTQEPLKCPQNCPAATAPKCTRSCVFTVFAHDHGSPRQDGRTYVTVNLLDSNDNDPRIAFRFNPPSAKYGTVDENAQNGTIVAAVSVVDPDEGPSGETLVRIIAGNELKHFRMERNHDVDIVRVNSALDREKINKYNLTFVATDKGSPPRSSVSHLIIVVNDVNDHEPVFEKNDYGTILSELAPIGSFVVSILATDEDTGINSNIFYSIASGNDNGWFRMESVTGLITTVKSLDREVQSVATLKISARDGGPNPRWAYTMLRVEILDENDEAPKFKTPKMNLTISENNNPNAVIATLTATDNDQGVNGSVHYRLSEETKMSYPGAFAVDAKEGHLTVLRPLDRETIARYVIGIEATDLGLPPRMSMATVILEVLDTNDNVPIFYPVHYFASVAENAPVGTRIVQVTALDHDEGNNGKVAYSIASTDVPYFQVSSSGDVELVRKLDNKVATHQFKISAKDGGDRKSLHNAIVDIVIVKNGSAQSRAEFLQPRGFSFTIDEDPDGSGHPVGREVGRIAAYDARNQSGHVTYSIISGDSFGVFALDDHGVIRTVKTVDREQCSQYNLKVLAKMEVWFGLVPVNITIKDVNDNDPHFLWKSATVTIPENWPEGGEVYLGKVEDKDVDENGAVTFNLTRNPGEVFYVNKTTGMVYLRKSIDYEKLQEYQLEVTAADGGNPPRSSKLALTVFVEDVNDHTPYFQHLTYEASLSELTPVNSRFHALSATDHDSGRNGLISYKILEYVPAFGIFPDGYLYVRSALDRESRDYYELTIIASDNGEEPRTSSVTIVVHVLDENDNSPIFANATFNFTLAENDPPDTLVGQLFASDRDVGRNSELSYSISNNQMDFVVDSKNGYVKTVRSFDREKLLQFSGQNFVSLEVVVSDNGIVRRRDDAKVNIFITDKNDNYPVFVRQPYKATVSEGTPKDTRIIRVACTDADEGANGKVKYVIVDGNDEDVFKMDESNGQVTLAGQLDREKIDRYLLTVKAIDSGIPSLSTTATIQVEVLDENDNRPQFENPPVSTSVPEDAAVGTELVWFAATDIDLDINGEVTYAVVDGNVQETFRMDSLTGKLYLEKPLDYETVPEYRLTINAIDSGTPHLSSTTEFTVTVTDINDNPPSLLKTPATRKIREGIAIGTPFLNVTAEDPDSGVNGQVRYVIESQEPGGEHFGIRENTGVLFTAREIDREFSPTFRLKIVATDMATEVERRLTAEKTVTIFVEDVNDNVPEFVSLDATVISEDAEKGYVVMTLSATDADAYENGQVAYELVTGRESSASSRFAVDRTSGHLYLTRRLDSDRALYNVTVRVVDGATNARKKFAEQTVSVLWLPTNSISSDSLKFERSEYKARVSENETSNARAVTVSVEEPNDRIRYFVIGVGGGGRTINRRLFRVDPMSGLVSTVSVLDREAGIDEYSVEILAVDDGIKERPRMARTKVTVTILDKNDSPPVFANVTSLPLSFHVSEDVQIGHQITTITATDPDVTGSINYSLISNDKTPFAIDPITGVVTVTSQLDRERKSRYVVNCVASDGLQSAELRLIVDVDDVNDNAPLFGRDVFSFDVAEDASRGTQIGIVSAIDADEDPRVSYALVSDWDTDVFALNPDLGVITLTSRLDYEKTQYYRITVQAHDADQPSLSSSVTVYVNVIDSNDNPPIFEPAAYSDEVYENVTVGTRVTTVTATDADSGNNGRVTYILQSGNDHGDFDISPNGVLVTARVLDRETRPFYTLVVRATDHGTDRLSATVTVNVIVRDVNDNAPKFVTGNSTAVTENASPNAVVMAIKAVDRDEGRNGYVEYHLVTLGQGNSRARSIRTRRAVPVSGPYSIQGPFVLGPVDGLLRVTGTLDRERCGNYSLLVTARDRGSPPLSTSTVITVAILDTNDNSPEFESSQYCITLPENSSIGASILQVSATDRDDGVNGQVRYSIVNGDRNQDFAISDDTGVVRVAKQLDYETRNSYVLTIQAEDGGNDARHDTATVTVSVTDVNDSPPLFIDTPYRVIVTENKLNSATILSMSAIDFDAPPNNRVTYYLKDGESAKVFSINGTSGDVTISTPLDRETKNLYEVTVIAMDSGFPRLTGEGTILVTVGDVNDNVPVFDKSRYLASIIENSPPKTIVTTVTATDNDLGLNAQIRYFLVDDLSAFNIDSVTGVITTRVSLDHEKRSSYQLSVMASDSSATAPLSAVSNVFLSIGDINDNRPSFDKDQYLVYIPAGTNEGQFAFGVTAVDVDSGANGRIAYKLTGNDAGKFSMNPKTGVAKLVRPMMGERDAVYKLKVEATDEGQPPLSTSVDVEVRSRPPKDFPKFTSTDLKFTLRETKITSSKPFGVVSATSPKPGKAGVVSYRIVGGNVGAAFAADAATGELRVKDELDYEKMQSYEIWIEAADGDDPKMTSVVSVVVNVTDVNDNAPIFERDVYVANVMEEEYPPLPVVVVKATDADSDVNGKVTYRLKPLGDARFGRQNSTFADINQEIIGTSTVTGEYFIIDAHTGRISTNARLDREEFGRYALTVEAVDHGEPSKTGSTTILVTILDKNDNPPRFTRLFSANVTENSVVGAFVIQVTSSDRDVGVNGMATYSFTENPGSKFKIDPVTGNVTVVGSLDREQVDEYVLKVSAVDGSWRAETPLTITIQDVNDNAPAFQQSTYEFQFPERQHAVTFVGRVTATDNDKSGPNSYVKYSLKEPSDAFEIDPSTGDVMSKRQLRFVIDSALENRHRMTIVASDHGKPSMSTECQLIVDIIAANDHAPVFSSPQYISALPVTAAPGLQVIQVNAVDVNDTGVNAEIAYSLRGGNASDSFTIDRISGVISVTKLAVNAIEGTMLVLRVEASDKGLPPKKSYVNVTLVVTSENEQTPVFEAPSYQVIIPENEQLGTQIVALVAKDGDRGINGHVFYQINSGNDAGTFSIDRKTGVLFISQPLDYELIQEYQLDVTAYDGGFHQKNSTAVIVVVVTDVNDNAPIFDQAVYDVDLIENSLPDASIIRVRATDLDSGRNAAVQYNIDGGDGKPHFSVDLQAGVIYSKATFDFEEKEEYTLDIMASNPDSVQYTTTTIKIHIRGVNEFVPKFVRPSWEFVVSESAAIGTAIGDVLATDRDSGLDGDIFYILIGGNDKKGFSVDPRRGTIRVARSLDRESHSRVTLTITAKNRGPIRGNDTDEAQIVVTIQDGNDPPVFSQILYDVGVREDVLPGHELVSVTASDGDLHPKDSQFVYAIISGNVGDAFKVDPQTGSMTTAKTLDRETVSIYNLTVAATDNGVPPQTGTSTVRITILDVNDNAPVFSEESLMVSVPENQLAGTVVTTLKATDADADPNGRPFTYGITGGVHARMFTMDARTGKIKTAATFDREQTPYLTFDIEVSDSGSPVLTSKFVVKVTVSDQNDSPSSPRNATVVVFGMEGVTYTSRVADLHPLDPDTTNDYRCEIVDGKAGNLFTIPEKCSLHVNSILANNTARALSVIGGDGKHPDVTSWYQLYLFTFSNATVRRVVDIRIANTSAVDFVASSYGPFLLALRDMVGTKGYAGGVFGVSESKNNTHLFVGAYKSRTEFAAADELSTLLTLGLDKLERVLGTEDVSVGYRPCSDVPCQNDGQCDDDLVTYDTLTSVDTPNLILTTPKMEHQFTCKCHRGFKGDRCEEQLDPCIPNPCQQGSNCVVRGQEFECLCPPTQRGRLCEERTPDGCHEHPCLNGGICRNIEGSEQAVCICRQGFQGLRCETDSGEASSSRACDPDPCHNGGTCISGSCRCRSGFFGPRCEFSSRGFGETSYLAFPPLTPSVADIAIIFSTARSHGLLVYTYGLQIGSRSDFLALEFVGGFVRFATGSAKDDGATAVVVNKRVTNAKWHKAIASRVGKVMSLTVTDCQENGDNCQECPPGDDKCYSEDVNPSSGLQFDDELLYVGGIRSAEAILDRPGQVFSDDFIGCIRSIAINGRFLDLNRPLASVGTLDSCPQLAQSVQRDDQQCTDDEHCLCHNGLWARDCDEALEPFSFSAGTFVEFDVTELYRRHQLLPHFYHRRDNSQASLRSKRRPDDASHWMSIKFNTVSENGILIHSATKHEFTLLHIHDGLLTYTSKTEFHPQVNLSLTWRSVSDGEWHNATLVRRGSFFVALILDGRETKVNVSRPHNFLDPYLTKLSIGGTSQELPAVNEAITNFRGCISTFAINGEIQPLDHSGDLFRSFVHGKLPRGCAAPVHHQGASGTDPLGVGVTLVIIFFVILMVAILISFVVFRHRRLKRDKTGSAPPPIHHGKPNGAAALLAGGMGEHWTESGLDVTGNAEETLRSHLAGHDLTTSKKYPREVDVPPQRPDIIEREVMNKSPGMSSNYQEVTSLDVRNNNSNNIIPPPSILGDIMADSELAPEHYDLENASSIAPSDIDIVYHYKGYRDGNVRKYKTNPHIPTFHKHNHQRMSPQHQYHSVPVGGVHGGHGAPPRGTVNRVLMNQSPTTLMTTRESPSALKMQSTPLARLSPSSEISQQTPRILTLQDISGRPLQTALLATSQGVTGGNSERSLNSPVSQLSQSTGNSMPPPPGLMGPRKDKKLLPLSNSGIVDSNGGLPMGLTAEEIERLNSRPRNSSLVSTLDVVSSSSSDRPDRLTSLSGRPGVMNSNQKKLSELLETNTELLEAPDSSTDESGNDSFTCSEFEYDNNNYERVASRGPNPPGQAAVIPNGLNLDHLASTNMIFSKLAEVDNEDEDDDDDLGSTKNFDGFDSFHGSLSTLVASDDDLSNVGLKPSNGVHHGHHVGWHYLLNWGPNFESLVGVFKDIAELPDSVMEKSGKKSVDPEYL